MVSVSYSSLFEIGFFHNLIYIENRLVLYPPDSLSQSAMQPNGKSGSLIINAAKGSDFELF